MNLEDIDFDDVEENSDYTSRRARFSAGIGARRLGHNLTAAGAQEKSTWYRITPPAAVRATTHS